MSHKPWTWLIAPELYRVEWVFLGALLLLSCLLPRRSITLVSLNRGLHRLANRPRMAVLAVILVVVVGRLALIAALGIPRPSIADEFGYLLTADTFAHGRMTNPTPVLWKSLETFHVFQTPTYQSQYPIGYPALMALAQVVLKNPWWAVFLATVLMSGAITWMLQAWLPAYWALMGGLFVALRIGLFSYWINSYWGASLPALGGALVFGALPRLTHLVGRVRASHRSSMLGDSVLLGLGMMILATTRPYEGFIVCLPAGFVFLYWLFSKKGAALRHALMHAAVPCVGLLVVTGTIMLYYQHKVTGHALESPYDIAFKQYHVTPPFVFQKASPIPHYNHLEMRWIYIQFEAQTAAQMRDPLGFAESLKTRFMWYWQFFVGPLMTLPLLAVAMTVRDRSLKLVWVTVFVLACGVLIENYIQVHYLAPGLCLFVLLLLQGTRHLKVLHVARYAAGTRIVRVLPVVCILVLGLRVFAFSEPPETGANHWPPNWAYSTPRLYDREKVEDALDAMPGQHLVLVRYRYPFHFFHREWVYNGADIERSKILWVRSMNSDQNCAFVRAYRGRQLWILDQWGEVNRFLPATAEDICDPANSIYEPNHPPRYYGMCDTPDCRSVRVALHAEKTRGSKRRE